MPESIQSILLSEQSIQWMDLNKSFSRDLIGRVFLHDKQIHRAIFPEAQQYVKGLIDKGIIKTLCEKSCSFPHGFLKINFPPTN